MNDFKLFKKALAYSSMESVLSGRNLILELSLKVDEKKTCFFRGGRKLKAPKLDCGPERTDSILL